jgi:hypothetical protein
MSSKKARSQNASSQETAPENRGRGQWLVVKFSPVSLFSLRMTHATSKGGKTLVVPTPYATKMALLDVCFRKYGSQEAETKAHEVFDLVKSREIRFRPPEQCVVQNTFIKILDQSRDDGEGPFKNTIAYREFVFYQGVLEIALASNGLTEEQIALFSNLFLHINSLGKRGSFWQYLSAETIEGDLQYGFTVPRNEADIAQISSYAMTLALDDFGEALCSATDGFNRVSTYGDGVIKLKEHRILIATAIPYRRNSASRSFTHYERTSFRPPTNDDGSNRIR